MQKQKNAVSKKAEKILLRVLDYFKEETKRLDMTDWGKLFVPEVKEYRNYLGKKQEVPACRTTACLAGGVLLNTKKGKEFLHKKNCFLPTTKKDDLFGDQFVSFPYDSDEKAAKILGIDQEKMSNLFYFKDWYASVDGNGWPRQFASEYKKAKTSKERFLVTKKRVLHFIKTGK